MIITSTRQASSAVVTTAKKQHLTSKDVVAATEFAIVVPNVSVMIGNNTKFHVTHFLNDDGNGYFYSKVEMKRKFHNSDNPPQ